MSLMESTAMEVPQVSIKQENVDNFSFTLATEPNVKNETEILNLMEIKVEPVKLEPCFYVPEPDNLKQEVKLSEEEKMNMSDCG